MDIYYVDGDYVDEEKACLSVKDMIVLRGFGIFDFMITYNKKPFKLQAHVARLENSAKNIGLELKHTNDEICKIVKETVRQNTHHEESHVRILYTGGISSDSVTPEGKGKLVVLVTPRQKLPPSWYTNGIKIITADIERFLPHAKSTNYLNAVYALQMAKEADAIETVYVDRNQRVLEGTTSNFFFFKNGKLITSGEDILPGITRSVVLELVKDHFDVEIRNIDRSELDQMDEAFLTASNKEVMPVVQVDDRIVNNGKPGQQTQKIMKRFKEFTVAYSQGKVD